MADCALASFQDGASKSVATITFPSSAAWAAFLIAFASGSSASPLIITMVGLVAVFMALNSDLPWSAPTVSLSKDT